MSRHALYKHTLQYMHHKSAVVSVTIHHNQRKIIVFFSCILQWIRSKPDVASLIKSWSCSLSKI